MRSLFLLFWGFGSVGFSFAVMFQSEVEKQVNIFPAPSGIEASDDYEVFADGQQVFCYATWRANDQDPTSDVNGRPVSPLSFALFDFNEPVQVDLVLRDGLISDPESVKILPSGFGIEPVINGNHITFTLDTPRNITVDPKGDGSNALHLFTSEPETDIPDPFDPNVIYFGPGVHEVETIILREGQTLYLAGGAVVKLLPTEEKGVTFQSYGYSYEETLAGVRVWGDHVTIRGRGILSGARAFDELKRFILLHSLSVDDLTVKGIVLMDPSNWSTHFATSRNLLVDNLKVLGYFTNSDGTVLAGCSNVVVRNSFVHNSDDGLIVKAWDPGAVQHVRYENCQIWSDNAAPLGIPDVARRDITDVVWSNVTVLHYTVAPRSGYESRAVFMVHPVGGGSVRDVRFENITVENSCGGRPLFHIGNEQLNWDGSPAETNRSLSSVSNVVFRNISVVNAENETVFFWDSGTNLVQDIRVENAVVNGNSVRSLDDLRFSGGNVISGNFSLNGDNTIDIPKFIGIVDDLAWAELDLADGGAAQGNASWGNIDGNSLDVSATYISAASANSAWSGMPQCYGIFVPGKGDPAVVELSDIPFSQYYVIVYVSGWEGGVGCITAGSQSYYWSTDNNEAGTCILVESSDPDTVEPGSYVVFGSRDRPLTDRTFSFSVETPLGTAIVGGFQVVDAGQMETIFPWLDVE